MIHYKYIKGMELSGTDNVFTFINFQSTINAPTITVVDADSETTGLGNILVTGTSNYSIDQYIYGKLTATSFYATDTTDGNIIGYYDGEDNTVLLSYDTDTSAITIHADTTVEGEIKTDDKITASSAEFYNGCNASYFNSTSDQRAKKDILPLDIDAIKMVCSVPVYSFVYKELDTPSIGIIAQEVQKIDINGFKIVDNEMATGQNFDYMSIHESKLVYILWKAVQELQKEIDELKNK